MTGKQLRNSILQWAIQGKLVPQDPKDEPASVLLERIRAEKARLVKEKKIKKDKNESIIFRGEDNSYYEKMADGTVRCIDSEIPFEIPESWQWMRLGHIIDFSKSKSVKNDSISMGSWVLDLEDIEKDTGIVLRKKLMKDISAKSDKHPFKTGNVLYSKLRPYLNKVVIADEDGVCTSEILVFNFSPIYNRYAQLFLMSPFFVEYAMSDAYGVKMPRLGSKQGNNGLMPVPPLTEQYRIIAKLDELERKIIAYGYCQDLLNELSDALPQILKKSILQEAIQGRLVPQIASEGTAEELLTEIRVEKERLVKEGKLKKSVLANESRIFRGDDNRYYEQIGSKTIDITDLLLFDIPKNWRWCRLSNVIQLLSGRDLEPNEYNDTHKGLPYMTGASNFSSEELLVNRWTENPVTISTKEDLLITCKGTIGQMAFNTIGEIHIARQIMAISGNRINLRYLKFFLESMMNTLQKQAKSMIPGISRNVLLNTLFPLPPIVEQNRIIERIDELLQHMKQG